MTIDPLKPFPDKPVPVGPEPEIIIGYKLGLGVAARLAEFLAAGLEAEGDTNAAGALRAAAEMFRGEKHHFEAQRAESLRLELEAAGKPVDER